MLINNNSTQGGGSNSNQGRRFNSTEWILEELRYHKLLPGCGSGGLTRPSEEGGDSGADADGATGGRGGGGRTGAGVPCR